MIDVEEELLTAQDELDRLAGFIADRGYVRCDIPACNCNSFHRGHAETRLNEIYETLGERVNGATALQAITALTAQLAWQPIETAPKDGTSVILYVAWRIVGEARWRGEGQHEGWWWAGEDPGDYHADKIASEVTHWMPLPQPPEVE